MITGFSRPARSLNGGWYESCQRTEKTVDKASRFLPAPGKKTDCKFMKKPEGKITLVTGGKNEL